ncbi:MAG: 1,4-alpha-glucan branching protein GlgB [Lachnospiraceae bacterium]|nr:1,4-alpha-glucan branching protein GlgB [Lachnospiraceae bacterium]
MERITEMDCYLFGEGTHYEIYNKLGAHLGKSSNKEGCFFAVWAPHAKSVSVVGDFNHWTVEENDMGEPTEGGVYEVFIPGVKRGDLYKFAICTKEGELLYKADPFARFNERRPGTASVVWDNVDHEWEDQVWLKNRDKKNFDKEPMAIYEVHPGSFMKHPGREGDDCLYTYNQLADVLIDYVLKMGYTHVEFMGICEYPYDGSWGYQVTGYYAPTARYGTPEDFAAMVDRFHQAGIGVILDWVPAHFPKDSHGLADFDGEATYEYADSRKGEHPDWGTKIFDYSKNEVVNFLIGSALFFVEEYHIDGLRVDAVASMLYLDYGKKDGQWVANKYGDNRNLEAIQFLKHLNSVMKEKHPSVMMIAEESTAWPKISAPVEDGGLGFTYKWNMGWMHDFLEYMKLDPLFRKYNHHLLTFGMSYNESEKFILVLSHDEVVHLKCSMINKMPGLGFDKFKNLMLGYTFFITHPGKKLLFMGQDIAQLREWSEDRELDWFLLEKKEHRQLQSYMQTLLSLYKDCKALHTHDHDWKGFEWINAKDGDRSILSFVRKGTKKNENLLVVLNFTPMDRPDYRCGVPKRGTYKRILSSAMEQYGGSDMEEKEEFVAEKKECDDRAYSFAYPLKGYEAVIFRY